MVHMLKSTELYEQCDTTMDSSRVLSVDFIYIPCQGVQYFPLIPDAIESSKETAMCNKLRLHHSDDAL